MNFQDLFSKRAALYASCRPGYPHELFEYLASLTPRHTLAWDCATGNGQAAVPLADSFESVVATDASAEQIAHAAPHPRVSYRVASADHSGLNARSVDLVTVAQALHWLDPHAFFAEARRVLVPGGAIAAWGYGDPVLDDVGLQQTLHEFNRGKMERYWTANRDLLLAGYQTLPFPFREIAPRGFSITKEWTLRDLTGYLGTWSATTKYVERNGMDPIPEIATALAALWGGAEKTHKITWPKFLRVGHSQLD